MGFVRALRGLLCAAICWSQLIIAAIVVVPSCLNQPCPSFHLTSLFFPFILLFNKYFLRSCYVSSPCSLWEHNSESKVDLPPGAPRPPPSLPPEPRALQPPLPVFGKKPLTLRGVTGLSERGQASGSVCPKGCRTWIPNSTSNDLDVAWQIPFPPCRKTLWLRSTLKF